MTTGESVSLRRCMRLAAKLRLYNPNAYPALRNPGEITGLGFIVGLATAIVLLVTAIIIPVQVIKARNCGYAERQFHRATHWDFFAGCYIAIGHGQSIPIDQYRAAKVVP